MNNKAKSHIRVGIVIVNWDNKTVLLECLNSLKKAGYIGQLDHSKRNLKSPVPPSQNVKRSKGISIRPPRRRDITIVIVDNHSTDNSIQEIKKRFPEAEVLEQTANLGYAGGNNIGIKHLLQQGADAILILNPDVAVNPGMIENLLEQLDKDSRIGIVGPKILTPQGRIWSAGGYIDKKRYSAGLIGLDQRPVLGCQDKYTPGVNRDEIDYISGTAMLVRRQVFETVGLFNEKYFIYYEDVELCQRAKQAGFKIALVPQAKIVHKESASFGKSSPAHQYYLARNHLLFAERNAPLGIKLRELIRLPQTLNEHRQKKGKYALIGISDYFKRRFGRRDSWN